MKSAFRELMDRLDKSDQRRYYWSITGVFLGYPPCCIHQFVIGDYTQWRDEWRHKKLPLSNSGYIPCCSCAARSEEDLTQAIAKRRIFSIPFPDDQYNQPDPWAKEMLVYKPRVHAFLKQWTPSPDQNAGLKALVEELCVYLAEHPAKPEN
jgi:hypothetical protein